MRATHILNIPSADENIASVNTFIRKVQSEYPMGDKRRLDILTSVNEAVTNAIHHGNRDDRKKKVTVSLEVRQTGKFIICITDEGKGFPWKDAPDPLSGKGLQKVGGRGIFIMRKLADRLIFNKKGNKVELHFDVERS